MPEIHLWSSEDLKSDVGTRVDSSIAQRLGVSRTEVQRWIRESRLFANNSDAPLSPNYKIRSGDSLKLLVPEPVVQTTEITPEDIPLPIVFEDKSLLVINKPPGLVVHPAVGHTTGTLVNALKHHCGDELAERGGADRLGIVHRLDKETSGLLVVAKTNEAHEALSHQFQDRNIKKIYQALTWGKYRHTTGDCRGSIGRHPVHRQKMAVVTRHGREAWTTYRVAKQWEQAALVQCELHTGRTHQIRVHLSHLGHSILGDSLYGKDRKIPGMPSLNRQLLHSWKLTFLHPKTGKEVAFQAEPPDDFQHVCRYFDANT